MKFTRIITVSFCALVLTTNAMHAQSDDAQEADHEALRNIKVVFEEAVNKNQMELIEPYLDKDFSVVTFTDREFNDFDKFKTKWEETREKMLKGGTYTVKLLPIRSQIIGDIAITKGDSENIMITGNGEELKFTAHWTAVCRKTDGEWKILRGHNSLNPFNNPMLKSGVKKLILKGGIGAIAAGIIIGLLVGKLIRKRANK